MSGVHTTTAFVNAVKECADCLKKNVVYLLVEALVYEKDPFASDSDSEQGAADEQNARQQSSGPEAVAQVPKEVVVHEARKVVVQEEADDDARSDDEQQGATTIGENNFLQFALDDLLTESTTDFNLDLCKVQVSRLFSKVRVGERVEAAKDMEQWMSVLALSHTESETMLKESEAVTEAAQQGLEERRQDIATLVGQSNIKISTLLKGFMQKVSQYRLETLDMLRAKYAKSAYDEFWDGLQDTIDKQATRRRSQIEEEHAAEVAAEVHRRLVGDDTGGAPPVTAVNPSVVAAHMLEAISVQQDETTYRKTRLEMEIGKKKQYDNILASVAGGTDDSVEAAPDRFRLSEAENDLLVKARADSRKMACDSILATEEGGRLAEKASGNDMEDKNQLFFDCQKLKLKAEELERELKHLSTPEERIKELELQVSTKRSQIQRAAKRSERRAKMRDQQVEDPQDANDPKGPDAASLADWLLSRAPNLEKSVEQVQEEYQKLKATFESAKENLLSERMESYGLKSGDTSKPKLEVLQQKLQESKEELQVLIEEKGHLEQAIHGPKKKLKAESLEDKVVMSAGDEADIPAAIGTAESYSVLFGSDGQPVLDGAEDLPEPSEFKTVSQSRPYLADLTKAFQLLEEKRAGLAAKLKLAHGESLEESDPGDREEASPVRQKNSQEPARNSARRGSIGKGGGKDARRAERADTRPGGDKTVKGSAIPPRPTRKGRRAIMGALKPAEDQPEVTEEAKAGVLLLLGMYKELEDARAQIAYTDSRIHRAKIQHDGRTVTTGEESDDDIDDGARDVNRELRREVQRKQRELNQLRKRWAEDKGKGEKAVARHAGLAGSAVRYLLQDRLQAEAHGNESDDSATESSEPSGASSQDN